jgi:hypothetical protein
MDKKKEELGNTFVRAIGLIGFIIATVGFLLVLCGVPNGGEGGSNSSAVLFNSFIMCTALAFAAILVTTMGHIAETLKSIERLLIEQGGRAPAKAAKPKKADK